MVRFIGPLPIYPRKKILIIGTGHIGKMIAKMQSIRHELLWNQYIRSSSRRNGKDFSLNQLKEVLPEVDFVVNILPLTEETTGLFDQHMFEHFDPKSVFINVGRGASVKTQDLVQALNNQQLSFAALDVFEEEPLPQDHPLWKMDNVLITSHIAGLTPDFQKKLMAIFNQSEKLLCHP